MVWRRHGMDCRDPMGPGETTDPCGLVGDYVGSGVPTGFADMPGLVRPYGVPATLHVVATLWAAGTEKVGRVLARVSPGRLTYVARGQATTIGDNEDNMRIG